MTKRIKGILSSPYMDFWVMFYSLLIVAGVTITSHGTLVFYGYFLPPGFEIAATLVVTLSILGMTAAYVLFKQRSYLVAAIGFLMLESSAQYLQGQADLRTRVLSKFPASEGIDLVTWVSSPYGRLLPIIFLVLLGIAVFGLDIALSQRIRQIQSRIPKLERYLVRLRKLQAERDVAIAQSSHAEYDLQDMKTRHEFFKKDNANLQAANAEQAQRIRDTEQQRNRLEADNAKLQLELRDRRGHAIPDAVVVIPSKQQLVDYVKLQLAAGHTLELVAKTTSFSTTTLASWIK